MDNNLQTQLDGLRSGWESRVGPSTAGLVGNDIAALRATGIVERALKANDRFPTVSTLVDAHNQPFNLGALIARQPVIITFYRGGWCPYCNLELRAYLERLADIHAMGAELVAVSPELPDYTMSTAEKNRLSFVVLTDVGGELAEALGIRFILSGEVRSLYEKAGHALPDRNGDGKWSLPLPAPYVVAPDGRIVNAMVDADYRVRLDPAIAIGALAVLQKRDA